MLSIQTNWLPSKVRSHATLRNLRQTIFLGKLNNAYLEAVTEEKLYNVAGPEFEDWEGYILTSQKHCID